MMDRKPTYEGHEQRVKELEKDAAEHGRVDKELKDKGVRSSFLTD